LSIKAVVFDYGQVITFPHDPAAMDLLAKLAGAETEKFEAALWSHRDEFDRGTLSMKEYYKMVLSSLGVSAEEKKINDLAAADLLSWQNINPGTVALMEDVKKAGYVLGILSNMPHDFLSWARKNIPALSLSQVSLFSCEVKLIKPEKAIYEKLLSMLSIKNSELVFFDDKEENVKGARDLGIEAFLWKNPETARRELLSLGVSL